MIILLIVTIHHNNEVHLPSSSEIVIVAEDGIPILTSSALVVDRIVWKISVDSIVLSFVMGIRNVKVDDEVGVTSIL